MSVFIPVTSVISCEISAESLEHSGDGGVGWFGSMSS